MPIKKLTYCANPIALNIKFFYFFKNLFVLKTKIIPLKYIQRIIVVSMGLDGKKRKDVLIN